MPTDTAPDAKRFAYGSVEDYAETIRANAADSTSTYVAASGIIGSVVGPLGRHLGADEQLARIRNVLAAAKLVREEMRAT